MRRHLWMHIGLIAAIVALFGLSALGVSIPTGVVYLVILACPAMMIFMMVGMNHDHDPEDRTRHEADSTSDSGQVPHPPANSHRT